MTTSHTAAAPGTGAARSDAADECTRAGRITRSLLGYGVIAGPLYVLVSAIEIATSAGFDPARHAWSQLALDDSGWIHTTLLIVTGLMTMAFAVGLRRAYAGGRGRSSAPLLVGAYGLSLVVAGLFPADPAFGFPVGAPDGPATLSVTGAVHFAAGAVGFGCLVAACFVIASRFVVAGRRRWAMVSRTVGALFGVGFAAMVSGLPGGIVLFTIAVITVSGWTCAVAVDLYRRTQH